MSHICIPLLSIIFNVCTRWEYPIRYILPTYTMAQSLIKKLEFRVENEKRVSVLVIGLSINYRSGQWKLIGFIVSDKGTPGRVGGRAAEVGSRPLIRTFGTLCSCSRFWGARKSGPCTPVTARAPFPTPQPLSSVYYLQRVIRLHV